MRADPQPVARVDAPYRPESALLEIAGWLGDQVRPADFPQTTLRWRNDRAAGAVGLAGLSDAEWISHFARFTPLPDTLPEPLALRYHGHQFRVYNPDLGDGRGFTFAQVRDGDGRLLELGTKGSGTTPWSRAGDGRLTLKGAVREILATEMLEALGVNTSKTLSVIETGEQLVRGDEPSPTRSAVMVRLSHGHIRIGSFQRLAALGEHDHLEQLVAYCLREFPGPPPPADAIDADVPAVRLMHLVVARLADLAASWMVAGFVHGVLNTDNMNVTGESFDYGPWRWLPRWDPAFTAAYFDHAGLYSFGRQPEALYWNCGQLAIAMRPLAEAPPLMAALERFGPLYMANVARRWLWRLGLASRGDEADAALVAACEAAMRSGGESPDAFFHRHRFGRNATGPLAELFAAFAPAGPDHPLWQDTAPPTLVIDRVEDLWTAIANRNDWDPLARQIAEIRRLGEALGPAPIPAGHLALPPPGLP
ncbi:YdiU family protein [Altererythrobacter aerius]|uniref:Protein nucleotidyltransferase YdiU n=1 Tax=Tsuneonella aeria TaxID=1837929 RepID=A0A6I4TI03_9SPHN|nr:YdiU family protein [Tsuneonella aeria]MXO76078.1 YdiU family protein [Tsuneonella aeria]